MTKQDLVTRIAHETGLSQTEAKNVIEHLFDNIVSDLAAGRTVTFRNFGTFVIKQRKPRLGRNPKAPHIVVEIPPRTVVKFKPSRNLQDRIGDPEPDCQDPNQ